MASITGPITCARCTRSTSAKRNRGAKQISVWPACSLDTCLPVSSGVARDLIAQGFPKGATAVDEPRDAPGNDSDVSEHSSGRERPQRNRIPNRSGRSSATVSYGPPPPPPGSDAPDTAGTGNGTAPTWTPPPPAAAAAAVADSAIEPDAIFDPDSDPATHTLPASFTAADANPRSTAFAEEPASFTHDPSQAPDPTAARGAAHQAFLDPDADPLDPESIAQLLSDASIYERMYEEFGMGGEDGGGGPDAQWDAEEEEEESSAEGPQEMDEDVRRRSGIILELASSTPETLGDLISRYREDLDEELLAMLFERIQVAKEFEEGDEVVEGLTALFRRLRTEVERAQATPAMRLLDDLLYVMDSDWGSSEAARLEAAQERMDAAFDPNSGGANVDIMAVAAALGAGAKDAVDDVVGEFVARPVFVAEVRELLTGAEDRAAAFEAALTEKEENFREGCQAGAYTAAEQKQFREDLEQQRKQLEHSLTSVHWCQSFLDYAEMPSKAAEGAGTEDDGTAGSPVRWSVPPEATARRR